MTTIVALVRLARVSNLPTVWSNVLAASVLAGGLAEPALAVVLLAMSALYSGGMILNDAFDRDIDARERPERPLPAGDIAPATAWSVGLGLLALGVAMLASYGLRSGSAALALAVAILIYNAWHKGYAFAPVIMGVCRALVYITTVLVAGAALSASALAAALALLAYVAGLSLVARGVGAHSALPHWPVLLLILPIAVALSSGEIGLLTILMAGGATTVIMLAVGGLGSGAGERRERSVGLLIAAIALVDGVVSAAHGNAAAALVCVGLFAMTVAFQRIVPGT
ncbi:UbiA family prenyltransferase [Hyphomicrobium sp.]|mgnify:FL=1|uniref:UbiA family prenyltransferase n=1 Tax=Hyphomicrobium sp. TaxID=82 RepID=UPI002C3FEB28|nr:UbiA family prenyltransferase [Hyphomicrobium sp.]HRN87256.1 UbiA family prenyltransferase [Hyphomicrobium sp.]HRQ25986.1 UbiA family prenyltransferase [Hyphomicrobium sp.]